MSWPIGTAVRPPSVGVLMKNEEIAELIRIIENSKLEEFELERSGVRIRIRKPTQLAAVPVATPSTEVTSSPPPPPAIEKAAEEDTFHKFLSPMVGTFYAAPEPEAAPFVTAGDVVQPGNPLCVIEAMKIFNQIDCDVDGEIVRTVVENGQPVEYGQPLFEIRLGS